jgi:hypothetical protein
VRKVSLVAAFLNHVERTKSQDYLHRFVEIAKGAFEGRNFVVDVDAEVMSEHGIGQVRVNDVVRGADGAVTVRIADCVGAAGAKNADCCCAGIGPDRRKG